MGTIGNGYGSECHLLRWMGRHRQAFDQATLKAIGNPQGNIEWLDFQFIEGSGWADAERKGLDFIADQTIQEKWQAFWPTAKGVQNWDAVGQMESPTGSKEWVLVEAKAHLQEIGSNCQAKDPNSRKQIQAALDATKSALGTAPDRDWTKGYYQFTNRLATLHFLENLNGIHARLLFIYFLGDKRKDINVCPATVAEWTTALDAQSTQVGLPAKHPLSDRIHKLFLRVDGQPVA